jgi:hypothetical protein
MISIVFCSLIIHEFVSSQDQRGPDKYTFRCGSHNNNNILLSLENKYSTIQECKLYKLHVVAKIHMYEPKKLKETFWNGP